MKELGQQRSELKALFYTRGYDSSLINEKRKILKSQIMRDLLEKYKTGTEKQPAANILEELAYSDERYVQFTDGMIEARKKYEEIEEEYSHYKLRFDTIVEKLRFIKTETEIIKSGE
jgi:hypothetical protein